MRNLPMILNGFIELYHAKNDPFWMFAACLEVPWDQITKLWIHKRFMQKPGPTNARYGPCSVVFTPNCCLRAAPIVVNVPTATPYWPPSAAFHKIDMNIFHKLGFYFKKADLQTRERAIVVGWDMQYIPQLSCWNFFMYRQQDWLLGHARIPSSTQEY